MKKEGFQLLMIMILEGSVEERLRRIANVGSEMTQFRGSYFFLTVTLMHIMVSVRAIRM